jgi:hypothetical protein
MILVARAPVVPNNSRAYTLRFSSRTRIQSSDSGSREVLARLGRSLFVRPLSCQLFALTEVYLQLLAGSSSLLSDTSGKLSGGISHIGGRYGFVTTTLYGLHRPPWRHLLTCLSERKGLLPCTLVHSSVFRARHCIPGCPDYSGLQGGSFRYTFSLSASDPDSI